MCVHAHVYSCVHVMYECMCLCVCVHVFVCVVCMCTCVCMCVCMHTYMCLRVSCACTYVCVSDIIYNINYDIAIFVCSPAITADNHGLYMILTH